MDKQGQLYTVGLWSVKAGKEAAFIAAWKAFAEWTVKHHRGALKADLLQDLEQSRRFISFGPWKDAGSIQAWRELAEFKAFITKARELCEDIQPRTLKSVAYVGDER